MKSYNMRINKNFGWKSINGNAVHSHDRHVLAGKHIPSHPYSREMKLSAKIPYAVPTKIGIFNVIGTTRPVPADLKRNTVPIPYPARWERRYIVTGVKTKVSPKTSSKWERERKEYVDLSAKSKINWKRERVNILGNKAFWRHPNTGFVEINEVERGAPSWDRGKYQVGINTPYHLDTRYFSTKPKALSFAKKWMKQHNLSAKLRVRRKAFTLTRKGKKIRVPKTTFLIKDLGRKGRGERLFPPLKKGTLMGWHARSPKPSRHRALNEAVRKYGYDSVRGKLHALKILNQRINPRVSGIAERDFNYVVDTYYRR